MDNELATLHATMRRCTLCADDGYDVVPGAVMSGALGARVMSIGQAPGITEVEAKRPFNASSGRRLFQWLGEAGFDEADYRARQYMTSVTKCYPGRIAGGKGDRVPSKVEQKLCRGYLDREVALVQPQLIIPIGGLAIKLFFPKKARLNEIIGSALYLPRDVWRNSGAFDVSAAQMVTRRVEDDGEGRYIVPLPHPSGASLWPNKPENKRLIARAITLLAELRAGWNL